MGENTCRIVDLRCKEVISIADGSRLGYVSDVEIDLVSGRITALVVPGKPRMLGMLGRQQDWVIPWEAIHRIGGDIILTGFTPPQGETSGSGEQMEKK